MGHSVRVKYDEIIQLQAAFEDESDNARRLLDRIQDQLDVLRQGAWTADAASAFYLSLDDEVLPALTRLHKALTAAAEAAVQIQAKFEAGEEEAAQLFRSGIDTANAAFGGSGNIPSGGAGSSTLS